MYKTFYFFLTLASFSSAAYSPPISPVKENTSIQSVNYVPGSFQLLGYYDQEHTRNYDGFTLNSSGFLIFNGAMVGSSSRFDSTGIKIGNTAWRYDNGVTQNIGLIDTEHTSVLDHTRQSYVVSHSAQGQVIGSAWRFDSAGNANGLSAWQFNNTTEKIGLVDAQHTRSTDGYQYNVPRLQNGNGQVIGIATRFDSAGNQNGQSVWLSFEGTTTQIGLVGEEHTRATDGYQKNTNITQDEHGNEVGLNQQGQVVGMAERFDHLGNSIGESAWQYSEGVTLEIGLIDAEHTNKTNGTRVNRVFDHNQSGQVLGNAKRYDSEGLEIGTSIWIYSQGESVKINLSDSEHTRSYDGYQMSYADMLNDQGTIIGSSRRYSQAGEYNGISAWIYQGGETSKIGLYDDQHTRTSDNYQINSNVRLNGNNQVIGNAARYDQAGEFNGSSAWVYLNGVTTILGMQGPEFIRASDGAQYSFAHQQNESGIVIGTTTRFSPLGTIAWQYADGQITNIGPTGAEFTRDNDGFSRSLVDEMNEKGQVLGYAWKFEANDTIKNTPWFYDIETAMTYTFDLLNQTPESNNRWLGLSEDGFAFGLYEHDSRGLSAFGFTVNQGYFDVTEWIGVDILAEHNLSHIEIIYEFNFGKYLRGSAINNDNHKVPFVLELMWNRNLPKQSIPESNTMTLMIMSFIVFLGRKKLKPQSLI